MAPVPVSAVLAAQGLLLTATATKTKSSSSSAITLLVLVAIAAAFYFLLIRPQQQRSRKQRDLQSKVDVGDEVLTIGGIVGTVLSMDDDRVTILTGADPDDADGRPVRLEFVRNAIARKIEPTVAADDHEEGGGESSDDHEEEAGA